MIKCKICGCEFTPVIDKHYVARDACKTGVVEALSHLEAKLYDTFDCPACGCQIVVQERKRVDAFGTIGTLADEDDDE